MRRINILTIAAVMLYLALPAGGPAFGQDLGLNGRLTGMGNSGAALIRGTDALGTNPALIAPPDGKHFTISLLPIGFHAGTDFMSFGMYKQYFTGVESPGGTRQPYYLQQTDKDAILGSFKGDVGRFAISGNYRLLALTAGWDGFAFGLDMTDRIGSNGAIPQNFVDFLFNGNPPGRTFDFSSLEFRSAWTRSYGLSLAKQLRIGPQNTPVSIGAAVKLVHGYGYFGVERFDSQFTTDPDSFVVYGRANTLIHYAGTEWLDNASIFMIELFPDPVGQGIGIDFGAHAQITPYLQFGASITDIGSITWDRGAKKTEVDEYFTLNNITSADQTEDLKERMNGSESDIASFQSSLPTALTIAAAYTIPDVITQGRPLHIAAALRNGFNNEPGNIEGILAGVGVEYDFYGWIPIRLGATAGGLQGISMSAGIGLKIEKFTLDIGTGNIGSAFSDGFSSSSFSITSHLDF